MFAQVEWPKPTRWHLDFSAEERTIFERTILISFFAGLTCLLAQIAFLTPFSPVPFTGQVLGVLGTGAYLRRNDAFASGVLYIGIGAIGLPVYAEGASGLGTLIGFTGGYLIAFPIASALVAEGFDRARLAGEITPRIQWGCWLGGMIIIYAIGATWLAFSLDVNAAKAWEWGVKPFILWDLAKMAVLAGITTHMWSYSRTETA